MNDLHLKRRGGEKRLVRLLYVFLYSCICLRSCVLALLIVAFLRSCRLASSHRREEKPHGELLLLEVLRRFFHAALTGASV